MTKSTPEAVRFARAWPGLLGVLLFALSGCHSCDKVEAELRAKDRELRQLRAEAEYLSIHNQAMQQELAAFRHNQTQKTVLPSAGPGCAIKEVVLGRLTGGFNEDECPGDEALQVVVEPRDADGHAVKVPGTLHIDVAEIRSDGFKSPLCSWTIPPDKLRPTWRSGLFSTGYSILLPWKRWPSIPKIRVIVHFTLENGRTFEAEKDCTIRLTRPEFRRPLPVLDPNSPPEVLPPPKTVPPSPSDPMPTKEPVSGPSVQETGPNLVQHPRAGTSWQAAKPAEISPARLERPTPIFVSRRTR